MMQKYIKISQNTQCKIEKMMVLFHGYGADMYDLVPLGEALGTSSLVVYSFQGLERCEQGQGYQWFSLKGYNPDVVEAAEDLGSNLQEKFFEAMKKHFLIVKKKLDFLLEEHSLTWKDVVLGGFSQGGAFALALAEEYRVSAVMSFSGFLCGSVPKDTDIFIAHGTEDVVVPCSLWKKMDQDFSPKTKDRMIFCYDQSGHEITNKQQEAARNFLQRKR